MKKLSMKTVDVVQNNIEKISEIFPDCVTECKDDTGQLRRKVDFDRLRQELTDEIVEGGGRTL